MLSGGLRLNGKSFGVALAVIVSLSVLTGLGRISPDALIGVVSVICGYYFGEARAFVRRNGG